MAIKSRAELKARFQTNKIPTQDDFANVIESAINLADDGVRKSLGDPLSVKAGGATQELLAFYESFESWPTPNWKINRKPGANPGFNIATGDGTSRLFIDEKTGAVNIGGINAVRSAEPGMLQVGDDTVTNSNGQLVIARLVDTNRNRAFKIGVTDDCHLCIYDLGHTGNRAHEERLTIEHGGRISVKKGLEVNGLLEVKGDTTISGKLDVNGTVSVNNGLKVKGDTAISGKLDVTGTVSVNDGLKVKGGVIKWGDGALGGDTKDPGIYSTIDGMYMKFATVNAPIKFFNNKAGEQAASGRPNMIIGKNGTVGLGTDNPLTISGCNVLQIGDDSIDGSSGQLIFGRNQGGITRSVRMGVDNYGSFSVGDFGNKDSNPRVYTEYLNIHWETGLVTVKKSLKVDGNVCLGKDDSRDENARLSVGGVVHISGVGTTDFIKKQGCYITWNREGFSGQTHFVNHGGLGVGGFKFENMPAGTTTPKVMAYINHEGNLYLKGDFKGAGSFKESSDVRIKRNILSVDGETDLALLNRLRIKDYDYLGKGTSERRKGIIAQEVEEFIPEAISQDTSFVADIFAAPVKITAMGDEMLLIMAEPHRLVNGDLVRLILPHGDTECAVAVVDEKSFRVTGNANDFKDVLVFGKQVSDFRRVNYNHLFTLNLSATQELSKKIDVLLAWKASLDKKMVMVD
ncbi:tail fiber domain-containing protein [Pedobacter alluvionis]|uniref:Endosialidase-like protein n=1 Tax=Pedobacter alluvionis TaxID=475253 RepID=A0A497YD35_9SPHI|nr:tail fiber domain-containing protein [Pedobacter alluvionis]RLJ79419.1 endosialidase-like protein [Pedobacter alluvionis]TFB30768.1 tail fiber domain-containing protein [Pedobacter alluvionis]